MLIRRRASCSTFYPAFPCLRLLTAFSISSHRLTGWNAVKSRVEQLGLSLTDDQVKDVTSKIKELADVRTQSLDDVDTVLRVYHSGIKSGELGIGQKEAFDRLLREHREASMSRERGESTARPVPAMA